jgi:hypothetical protein
LAGITIPITITVCLVWVGDFATVVTAIIDPVTIAIFVIQTTLVSRHTTPDAGARGIRAVVTGIAISIIVDIRLVGVRCSAAVVAIISKPVTIPITVIGGAGAAGTGCRGIWAKVAGITKPIKITVCLIRVGDVAAVVTVVTYPVSVFVSRSLAAGCIARISYAITIGISLILVRNGGTIVAGISKIVPGSRIWYRVRIGLVRV